MSTTVYDGYVLAEGTDIFEFQRKVREVMDPIRDRLDVAEIVSRAEVIYDRVSIAPIASELEGRVNGYRSALSAAFSEYATEQRKEPRSSTFHDPHRCGFSVGVETQSGLMLAVTYFGHRDYSVAWEELPEVTEYAYWNNVDEPEHVTFEQWRERGAVWERLVGDDAYVRSMLSFDLRPENDSTLLSQVGWHPTDGYWSHATFKSVDERASNMARQLVERELWPRRDQSEANVSGILRNYDRLNQRLKELPQFDDMVDAVRCRMQPLDISLLREPLAEPTDEAATADRFLKDQAASLVDEQLVDFWDEP